MGGHGGLNILPQKRWNVYNFENREKVEADEEAAAEKEKEQAEEQRRRDGEARLNLLRSRARQRLEAVEVETCKEIDSAAVDSADLVPAAPLTHVNLFADFEEAARRQAAGEAVDDVSCAKPDRKKGKEVSEKERSLKDQRSGKGEKEVEDERYKLGYGVVGKEKPWYSRKETDAVEEHDESSRRKRRKGGEGESDGFVP